MTHEAAAARATLEYERFAALRAALPSPVERHFDEATVTVKRLEAVRPRSPKRPKR